MANTTEISSLKRNDVPVLYSLRAIAALSVCAYHFICTTIGLFHNPYLLGTFDYGKFGVQMFFVISGFIIPWSMYYGGYTFKKFFTFLFKRLLRLEPPYLASLAIAVILFVSRQRIIEHSPTIHFEWTRLFLHFGYLIPFFKGYAWFNPVYWTLAIEFQFYFFMAFFFLPLVKGKLPGRICFYAVTIGTAFFFHDNFLPQYLPFFVLGIVLFLRKTEQISQTEFYIVSAIVIFSCIYNFNIGPTLFAVFAFVGIAFFQDKDTKVTHSLGEISYSIYLFHTLIGATFINVLSHNTHTLPLKILLIVGGIAITIIGSYIMYWLVERPSKKLSGKLKYRS